MSGHYTVQRAIHEFPEADNLKWLRLYMELQRIVQWHPSTVMVNGNPITLQRFQCLTSEVKLAGRLNISRHTIRKYLGEMETHRILHREKCGRGWVITVFQDFDGPNTAQVSAQENAQVSAQVNAQHFAQHFAHIQYGKDGEYVEKKEDYPQFVFQLAELYGDEVEDIFASYGACLEWYKSKLMVCRRRHFEEWLKREINGESVSNFSKKNAEAQPDGPAILPFIEVEWDKDAVKGEESDVG